jgi:hypothetical protein
MTGIRCTCGFAEVASEDYTISDHLHEVFAPADGKTADGVEHAEGREGFLCLCGAGGNREALDAHFLEAFTPGDSTGPDVVINKAAR